MGGDDGDETDDRDDAAETRDRASLLGVLGGGFTALSAVGGYYVVPLVTGDVGITGVTRLGLQPFWESTEAYHAAVLVTPSFLATLAGILLARRWGSTQRVTDAKIVAGNVLTPVVTAVGLYALTASVIGLYLGISGVLLVDGSSSLLQAALGLLGALLMALFGMLMAILIGGVFFLYSVLPVVLVAVVGGTLGGYLVARTISSVWSLEPDAGDSGATGR